MIKINYNKPIYSEKIETISIETTDNWLITEYETVTYGSYFCSEAQEELQEYSTPNGYR